MSAFRLRLLPVFLAAFAAGAPVGAEVADAPEHPIVSHYPGAMIDDYDQKDFDAAMVVVDYTAPPKARLVRKDVEGKVTRVTYIHQDNISALQAVRTFEAALKAKGLETIVVSRTEPFPELETRDGSYVGAFRLVKDKVVTLYVQVLIDPNVGEPVSRVTIVEPGAMAPQG